MIKENLSWNQPWYFRRQVLRCAALLPECGLEKGIFVASLPEDCQVTAREMIRDGVLRVQNDHIMPPSPLLVQNLALTEDYIIDFLGGLYVELASAIDEEFQKKELSLKDRLLEIRRMRGEICDNGPEDHIIIGLVDCFLERFRLPRIGSLGFAKEDINRIYNSISIIHYQQFGDARMNAIREFYQNGICQTLKKALEIVPLSPNVQENVLERLIEFYNLAEMLTEPLEPALRLMQLYKERNAPNWQLAWVCMVVSDAYMGCFATRDDWIIKSNEYLELSCEFSKKAYEDTEKEKMEAQLATEVFNE